MKNQATVWSEVSTSSGYVPPRAYALDSDGKTLTRLEGGEAKKNCDKSWNLANFKHTLAEIFLPYGYPDSVSDDYLAYQFFDTMQAFCSSLVGTLATHAVLTGLGVGSQDATPLAATLTWLTKDGLGMVGRITFVWYRGSDLDNDLKCWRFMADILNDAAFFIDMLSAVVPKFLFTPMVCLSSASRAIVGVAGGATRTALVQHQALRGNAADVSAKDGSQETIVNLSALIVSLLLVPALEGNFYLVWFLYALLTFLHLYSNYRAVKTLRLRSLNDKRMSIAVEHFTRTGTLPSIDEANQLEPVLIPTRGYGCKVRIGVSLSEFFDSFGWQSAVWEKLQTVFRSEKFILFANSSKKTISVVLNRNANAEDIIFCGYLCQVLSHGQLFDATTRNDNVAGIDLVDKIYRQVTVNRDRFFKSASAMGWKTDEHNLTIAGQYRFEQNVPKME